MIFVTTGTQVAFDRFIKIIDHIAPQLGEEKIIAQICNGDYKPQNIESVNFVSPNEFNRLMSEARIIVSHAGMGTIISSMKMNKPIIIFPRIAALGEHRNEHQLATARKMKKYGYVYVAETAEELQNLLLNPQLESLHQIGEKASQELVDSLSDFIG